MVKTLQQKRLEKAQPLKKVLCANPHELPINGSYEAVNGKTYYHGKYANPEEVDEYKNPLCKWCRKIEDETESGCEEDYSEEDQSAEDEAIAYDRMKPESEIVM